MRRQSTARCHLGLKIGCSGWSYDDWVGPFYPKDSKPQDFLKMYSRIFDCVEIDSTFYRAPSPTMVQQWCSSSPDGFVFAPKVPKRITHDKHLQDVDSYLSYFLRSVGALNNKLGPIIVQLPPSFKSPKHEQALKAFVTNLRSANKFAIEFRHKSWFGPGTEKLLRENNVCQVWSVNQYLATPSTITSDFVYLRLVGDRAITEFKGIQKDQGETMRTWSKSLRDAEDKVQDRFVLFNNHFAGFGPGSANEFRRLMGLVELDWSSLSEGGGPQRTLMDFPKGK